MKARNLAVGAFPGAVALLFCACNRLPEPPQPERVEPGVVSRTAETSITIHGRFWVDAFVSFQDSSKSYVHTDFAAQIGDVELLDVTYIDFHSLIARVPAGMQVGTYDLTIVDPADRMGTLVDSFTVVPCIEDEHCVDSCHSTAACTDGACVLGAADRDEDVDGLIDAACTGGTDCDDQNPNCTLDCTDTDGDTYCVTHDCDDLPDTGPTCATGCAAFFADADADTYGDPLSSVVTCTAPPGYVVNGTDCADTPGSDPACNDLDGGLCNPSLAGFDLCDGANNDCDATTDEDFLSVATSCGVGACASIGVTSCVAGIEQDSCVPGAPALGDATCDGIDDDCDGTPDQDYAIDVSCGVGHCQTTNTPSSCIGGVETPCSSGAELAANDATCDGVDDNCSGMADEDYVQDVTCGVGYCQDTNIASSCAAGIETPCLPGNQLSATDATCDDVDDNCSGVADEEYVVDGSCGVGYCKTTNTPSSCTGGIEVFCSPGAADVEGPFSDASCSDGIDNDCDGDTDLADLNCTSQCSDGLDNDADTAIDFPNDPGCANATDDDEFNAVPPETCIGDAPGAVPADGFITGSTGGSSGDDYVGSCGGTQKEDVFFVEVPAGAAGLLAATDYPGTDYDTLIYLRDACDDGGTEIDCDDNDGSGNRSFIQTGPVTPGTYFLFIDGSGATGSYDARIQVLVAPGGACQPTLDYIRCIPEYDCLVGGTSEFVCQAAGCTVEATYTDSFTVTGTTVGRPVLHAGTCGQGNDGGLRGPESVYVLSLASAVSNVNVSTANPGTDYDTLIYMRDSCTGTEVACNDDTSPCCKSAFDSGPLVAGDYYIFVDGFAYLSGNYELTVSVTP